MKTRNILFVLVAMLMASVCSAQMIWNNWQGSGIVSAANGQLSIVTTAPSGITFPGAIFTTPNIGVATGTSLAVTGLIKSSSPTAGIGYATGAGGTVTQITNRSTGVTINTVSGYIQTDTTSLAAAAAATFTVTDSAVAVGDVVVVCQRSGATNTDTIVQVTAVAAGSFNITVKNDNASTAETGAILINFVVIKAVSA